MCIGCDLGHQAVYLDTYLYPYERALHELKRVEKTVLAMLQLDLSMEHTVIVSRHHKRLVRARKQWGRAHQELAKDIAEDAAARERERKRTEALPRGPAIQAGDNG